MPKSQLSRQQRNTSPKRILGAIVALVVAFLLLASVVGLAEKYVAIRHRVRDLKGEEKMLLEKKAALKATNDYVSTAQGEEHELRSKYNVIKPGEGMIVITTPEAPDAKYVPSSRIGRWWDSLLRGLGVRK